MPDIFIVGPARSGTSWLQTMLAEHPDVASPPETGLFVEFLAPMERAWQQHRAQLDAARAEGSRMNVQGLATVVTSSDMLAWYRTLYAVARERVLAGKPGATRLLEKTPDHALCLDLIWKVAPDARVVFLVRDPRATVRSMLHASAEPWGHWASTAVEGATGRWQRNVQNPLARREDPRMITVRYEDLRADERELARVTKFLELGNPSEWLATPTDASPRDRQSNIVVAGEAEADGLATYELEGFSFHDRKQQRELSRYELAYVENQCGAEMRALGYAADAVRPPVGFRVTRSVRIAALRARHYWRRFQKSRRG
jgi:Sulfotransferase family